MGSCLLFIGDAEGMSFDEASSYCETHGAKIVIENSQAISDWVKSKIGGEHSRFLTFYILYDNVGAPYWIDNSAMNYQNWLPSHPNPDYDCLAWNWAGNWLTNNCDHKYSMIGCPYNP